MGVIDAVTGSVSVDIPLQYSVNNSSKKSIIEGHTNSTPIPLPTGMGELASIASAPGGMIPEVVPPAVMSSIQAQAGAVLPQLDSMIDTLKAEIGQATASLGMGSPILPPTFSVPDPVAGLASLESAKATMSALAPAIPPVPGLIGTPPIAQAKALMDSVAANSGSIQAAALESANVSSGLALSSPTLPTPPAVPSIDDVLGPITGGAVAAEFSSISGSLSSITSAIPPAPSIGDMVGAMSGSELGDIAACSANIVAAANTMITDVSAMMGPVRNLGNAGSLLSMNNNPSALTGGFAQNLPTATLSALGGVDVPSLG